MSALHAQNHRTGGKEEQRLEERVRHQMEHPRDERAHAHRRDHEAQLADGGIREDFLDIVLPDGNGRGEEGGNCAGHRDDILRLRHRRIKRRGASHQIDACGHHRRRVDERGHRRRTCHRVRQPDIERNLGRFPRHADEHEEGNQHNHALRHLRHFGKDFVELKRAKRPEGGEHREEKTEISHAVGNEGFFARQRIRKAVASQRIFVVPKADEEIRTQPHAFPSDKEHQVRRAAHQNHHHRDEEVEENEEAAVTSQIFFIADIFVHVADGVNMDERPDRRDDEHHRHREGIHAEGPRKMQRTDHNPVRERHVHPLRIFHEGIREEHRDDKRQSRRRTRDRADCLFAHLSAKDDVYQQSDNGKEDNPGNEMEEQARGERFA